MIIEPIPTNDPPQRCARCGAALAQRDAPVCPACGRSPKGIDELLDSIALPPGIVGPVEDGVPAYDSMGWAFFGLLCATAGFGFCAFYPGVSVALVLLGVPALLRCLRALDQRGPGSLDSANAAGLAFLGSFGIVCMIGLAACVAFLVPCACGFGIAQTSIGLGLIVGLGVSTLTSLYVFFRLLIKSWPKYVPPRPPPPDDRRPLP